MSQTLLTLLKFAAVVYLGIIVLMYLLQRQLLYFPTDAPTQTPVADGIAQQTVEFNNNGISLKGWVINPGQTRALLYFGGNAEQIEQNSGWFRRWLPHTSVYLINYRGYGHSSGKPTQNGLFSDALSIYDQIAAKHQHIIAMGRSLGSGIATYLAARRDISQLLLITPYDSIANVARQHYPYLPVGLLLKDHYASWKMADKVSADTLLLIAEQDRVIPPAHAARLATYLVNSNTTSVLIDKAGHNDISAYPAYTRAIVDFLPSP